VLNIIQTETPEHIDAARELFVEYENWLGVSLCFQGFEEELAGLPGKYASPAGRLFLVFYDGELAGCGAFRQLEEKVCEIKRIYVREKFRGHGIGRKMLEKLIDEARAAGYESMRLDSWIPRMQTAIAMYRKFGFGEIEPYNENPYEMIFMEKQLQPEN
jgi:GNAT superfamily N-acetyltransferase